MWCRETIEFRSGGGRTGWGPDGVFAAHGWAGPPNHSLQGVSASAAQAPDVP
jgi:hypothetical protein